MIYIVSDYRGTYHLVVDRLREHFGAELIELDPARGLDRNISKLGIVRQLLTPRLLRLRNRWTEYDTVLVMSWYLIPLIFLVRFRVLTRPRRLVSLGAFVHDECLRRAVNLLLRFFTSDELEFIVFSGAEAVNLTQVVGVPSARVHRVLYRGKPEDSPSPGPDGGYIFTGGYSNRDYETFFAAVGAVRHDVVAVASALNDLHDPPENVDLRLDISWDEFEELIRRCALLVLPLRKGGEACGQGVLVRGIHHHRPVVATRHDSLVDYLGEDYAGFVSANDPEALRVAIERALHDDRFRHALVERVQAAARSFREQEQVDAEIAGILAG